MTDDLDVMRNTNSEVPPMLLSPTTTNPPEGRTSLDLRPLHSALSRAQSLLDILYISQSTAMVHGTGLWLAKIKKGTLARSCASGPECVDDGLILDALADMAHFNIDTEALIAPIYRWHDNSLFHKEPLPRDFAQIEIVSGDKAVGLLRVYARSDATTETCDWEAVEQIMCMTTPYLMLAVEQEGQDSKHDALTGLMSEDEFRRRVEREVDLARTRPVELALVIMELRLGDNREPNMLSEAEWRIVGSVVRSTFRDTDSSARLSDGRLAVLMPMTNQRPALMASARLVERLRSHPQLPDELTCQAGLSGWTFEGASAPELFEQAGTALDGARIAGARGAFVFV